MSPLEFLKTFRKNITPTFTNGNASTFYPLVHYVAGSINIDDTQLFNSDDEGALGSLITIHIPIWYPLQNNGTVVLSDYKKNTSLDHYAFTFTTTATLYDGTHPVAGNRRFGIIPHANGGYEFYIMGVDRMWEFPANLGIFREMGFGEADILWNKIQENMVNYVNYYGGAASFFLQHDMVARVPWDGAIIPFLLGKINYNELKNTLNCP